VNERNYNRIGVNAKQGERGSERKNKGGEGKRRGGSAGVKNNTNGNNKLPRFPFSEL